MHEKMQNKKTVVLLCPLLFTVPAFAPLKILLPAFHSCMRSSVVAAGRAHACSSKGKGRAFARVAIAANGNATERPTQRKQLETERESACVYQNSISI